MRVWLERALKHARREPVSLKGDVDWSAAGESASFLKPAAVLVTVIDKGGESRLLLTKRAAHLSQHAGQISFPGGKMDAGDSDPIATALREAYEEIGLDPADVEILGVMEPYYTITGYAVTPVIGLVRDGLSYRLDPSEVVEIFEVPFDFILERKNHKRQEHLLEGRQRSYYAMPYGDYYIWGATAAMLINLVDLLEKAKIAKQ